MMDGRIKQFLMDFGIFAVPVLLIGLLIKDRKTAARKERQTAKARRTRKANLSKGKRTKSKKKGKAISKTEKKRIFLARMAKGRAKAKRLRNS